MRVRGLLHVAAALLVLPGVEAQKPAASGDAEKLVLPALELRDPARRSVLGDEVPGARNCGCGHGSPWAAGPSVSSASRC